jgi:hypothetical protein
MRSIHVRAAWVLGVSAVVWASQLWRVPAWADEPTPAKAAEAKPAAKPGEEKKKFPEWDKVVEGAKRMEGLFPLYYNEKEQKLFLEFKKDQYDKEMILPIAIARGAGLWFLGGETLNFGDQWVISFRRAGDRFLVIRHNVRFKADKDSPQADAVKTTYTDSVLKALPIKSEKNDGQLVLIDLADLFFGDLAGIGITPDPPRSTWAKVKVFPKNVEIEVSAVFTLAMPRVVRSLGGGDSVPDPRGMQVVIHYGLSMLPTSSYKTRLADDRVGHFLSTVKDFSKDVHQTPNVRYVTRWNLEKEKAKADKSPPKQPIIFWIERSVPREYRQYVRDGLLEWNKTFEKAGFIDAIQVRDQQADDDFDPEDIRYNTFRWITTSAGFAMGPSRTNPRTGEILDADIIFDEGMIRYWRQEYLQTAGIPAGLDLLFSGQRQAFFKLFAADLPLLAAMPPAQERLLEQYLQEYAKGTPDLPRSRLDWAYGMGPTACPQCQMGPGMQRQLDLLASVLAAKGELEPGGKVPEKFIGQAIKYVTMHEVGHTLGLRHNFKASSAYTLAQANNPEFTRDKGNSASIMDYLPANIAPKGEKQGDYFTPTIGPYDYWAIEYAYKPVEGDEAAELTKIATRAPAPELTYGTDEDIFLNPDPRINTYDLGDPLEYAVNRLKLAQASLDDLQNRVVSKGEGWQRARIAFLQLIREKAMAASLCLRYAGGEYTTRDHRDDPNGRPPMKPIEIAKQREAIRILKEEILSAKAFQFKPDLLRHLAPEHWREDMSMSGSYQYPVLKVASSIQRMVLTQALDGEALATLQEIAQHADPGQETLQIAEVFDATTAGTWGELPTTDAELGKLAQIDVPTLRRNLQREHVRILTGMILGSKPGPMTLQRLIFQSDERSLPPDARSLARQHLRQVSQRVERVLGVKTVKLDSETRAHLEETRDQIDKVFKASMEVNAY